MPHQKIVLAALLAGLFGPAIAGEGAASDPRPGPVAIHADRIRMGTVKNAPYSAVEVTERLQNLGDGNQIAQRTTTMRYRDTAGRTRDENGDTVTINDPVAGQVLVLKPQARTVTKIAAPGQDARIAVDIARVQAEAARQASEAAHAQVEQMRKDGSLPTVERRKLADGGDEIIVKRVERVDGNTRERVLKDVRIQVPDVQMATRELRNVQIQLAPLTRGVFGDAQWSSRAVTKDLGTREFDGVKAEGKLRSYEIPAGAIGNRNPIVVSDETWYAPDLHVTVFTKHSDPRSGDFVFKLDKIKREEPPAALFTVPADYMVTDPLAQARAHIEGKERKERSEK